MVNHDRLELMLTEQHKLDSRIIKEHNVSVKMEDRMKQNILAIMSEIGELMEGFHWKHWKRRTKPRIKYMKEELIDIQHFLNGMYLTLGMSADEVYEMYMEKNRENHGRQDGVVSGREDYKSIKTKGGWLWNLFH